MCSSVLKILASFISYSLQFITLNTVSKVLLLHVKCLIFFTLSHENICFVPLTLFTSLY